MKKLIFVFLILLTLVVIAGCNARRNTITFNPQIDGVTSDITTTITKLDNETGESIALTAKADSGPDLAITNPAESNIKTADGYLVIRGTTPRSTHRVMINSYTLQKYYPGQTRWSYIASSSIGTLKEGVNNYTVHVFDRSGNELGSKNLSIAYEPAEIPNLPYVGNSLWVTLIMTLMGLAGIYGISFMRRKTV